MRNTLYAALLFMLSQILQKIVSTSIENSVSGKPSIRCDSDSISIIFSTAKPFTGRTFVKGYIQDSNCIQVGNSHDQHKFTIKFNQCGLRRSREYNGIRITTTVIVSFHPIFLTKVDRAYRLNCFYMESSKTITQQLEISMMTTEELHRQTQMPVCRYEILSGSSKGQPIRYAKVGDSVYHRWTCLAETEDLYCMRVHTCTVSDGQGGEAVEVLDSKGCSVDKYLLLDLEYTDDLTAGRESHVFKFADRPALYFNCQLQLTTKDRYNGCRNEHPICTSQSQIRVEPSEQTYEQAAPAEKTITSSYQTNNKEQNYPTPADADYKSNELPYQSNEVVYPSPPGPPAPPTGTISSRVHLPSKSVYSADSNYEDITTVSHKEEYSQTLLDSYGPVQETTTFYEEEFAYKRLIRRRRNSTKRSPFTTIATSLHVVDVDLPEQRLMVFDIEDDHPLLTNREMQSGNLDRLLNPMKDSRTCFSSARLSALLIATVITIVILNLGLITFLRKRRLLLRSDFMK